MWCNPASDWTDLDGLWAVGVGGEPGKVLSLGPLGPTPVSLDTMVGWGMAERLRRSGDWPFDSIGPEYRCTGSPVEGRRQTARIFWTKKGAARRICEFDPTMADFEGKADGNATINQRHKLYHSIGREKLDPTVKRTTTNDALQTYDNKQTCVCVCVCVCVK